jgi:antitoxin MazE
MQTKVQRWGNSLAVRIPKAFADDLGLAENSSVALSRRDRDLILTPVVTRTLTLASLLAEVTDENLHHEAETGPPVGDEVW